MRATDSAQGHSARVWYAHIQACVRWLVNGMRFGEHAKSTGVSEAITTTRMVLRLDDVLVR